MRSVGSTKASLPLPQIGENSIAQVKLAFDPPAPFVFQFTSAIERVDELPFRFNQRKFEFIAKLGELLVMLIAVLAILDVPEPVAQMSADRSRPRAREACGSP